VISWFALTNKKDQDTKWVMMHYDVQGTQLVSAFYKCSPELMKSHDSCIL